jgi:hypothetical protein
MTVAELHRAIEGERRLGRHLEEYPGQWVAVCDQKVVAHAETLGELLEQIESQGLQDQATVLQVPAEQAAACFF